MKEPTVKAPPAPVDFAQACAGRSLTLILPGPVTYDGTVYRAFRPYARLANTLTAYFDRVTVSTQVVQPGSEGFEANDGAFYPTVEVQGLPEPLGSRHGIIANIGYQLRRGFSLLRLMTSWDIIYAFVPSFPGAIGYTANRFFFRRPIAVYLANDWEEITRYTFRWTGWRRRLLFPLYHGTLTRWERWIVRTAPLTITAGRALLRKYDGENQLVFEAVPLLEMTPADMLEREDTFNHNPPRLLYVGTLHPRKGLPVLFEALELLVTEGREFELDIVGDGTKERRSELEEEARQRGIYEHIRFYGFIPSGPLLYRFYREADAFVLPTYSEGFPRVLYEALGHGLPVVASSVSGIPHLLEHERHALLVPPGQPQALARAIGRLFEDPGLRCTIIREGRNLVRPIIGRDAALQFVELCRRHLLASDLERSA
ncbi:MAG: glycosyltransferase family 4 protein [Acidobacteriota bacterium]